MLAPTSHSTLAINLFAVAGSTHTVHWATKNDHGRLWPLCAIGGEMSVARQPEADCTNCRTIAETPEALTHRAIEAARF